MEDLPTDEDCIQCVGAIALAVSVGVGDRSIPEIGRIEEIVVEHVGAGTHILTWPTVTGT